MLPITDFHFAFCGIATVAATLGYACARRTAVSLASTKESKADIEAGPTEERPLKRKLDASDERESDAEEQSRPMKRSRTPPIDQHEDDEDEWEVVVAPPPPYEQAVGLQQPEQPVQDHGIPHQDNLSSEQEAPAVREITASTAPESPLHPEKKGAEAERCSTPQPSPVNLSANEPEAPPARPVTPPKPIVPAATKPINAFSALSGSSSPFASYSNPAGTSPFALSGQAVKTTPAWRRDSENTTDVFAQASPANALAPSPNDAPSALKKEPVPEKNVFESANQTPSLAKSSTCLTGEEDETVVTDLRGVKLFIKRGRKEFTDGMYGHIKILRRKATPTEITNGVPQETEVEPNAPTRLLFRRDPLGQVSMNVGLHPTIRCHFDAAENILRVVLVEQVVVVDGKDPKDEILVYALKPGRAAKADFQSFAKTLCDQEGLKSRPVAATITSTTTASPSDAAAS